MSIKGRGGQQGIGAYRNKRVKARREAKEQRSCESEQRSEKRSEQKHRQRRGKGREAKKAGYG